MKLSDRGLQTILVSRKLAPTRKKAETIARKYADRIYTSRKTKGFWRFRQRPPSCFAGKYRTKVLEEGDVQLVFAEFKLDSSGKRVCR